MKLFLYIALATISYIAARADINPLSDEYIKFINSAQSTWTAGRNFDPDTPMTKIRSLLGAKKSDHKLERKFHVIDENTTIPDSFDARENWPGCASIKAIYDQSSCGSCWAVSTTNAMSDRLCIHSNGTFQGIVSAINLLSCCKDCSEDCLGGMTEMSWTHWMEEGIVTGGGYNTTTGCQAYPYSPCQHYNQGTEYPACSHDLPDVPKCVKKCDNDTSLIYENELTFGKSAYLIHKDEKQIQIEILKNGPVVADLDVYDDFLSYKSGVYIAVSTSGEHFVYFHSVRVLGWGVENDVPYWLIANSFNEEWGDKGLFKIIRGINHCHIESNISVGMPKV